LHRDDTELIFFVNPHKESFVVVVEDTTSLGPVTLKTARFKVLVSTLEEEVISDELFLFGISHLTKRVILTLELTFEGVQSLHNFGLDEETLFTGDGGTEGEFSQVTGDTDTG